MLLGLIGAILAFGLFFLGGVCGSYFTKKYIALSERLRDTKDQLKALERLLVNNK